MTNFNITQYFNDSFGIDAANHVNVTEVLNHLDDIDTNIDVELEAIALRKAEATS